MNRILLEHPYFSVSETAAGEAFLNAGDNVLVVALDDHDRALLVTERSVAFGGVTLGAVCGQLEPEEDPLVAANRELQDESGVAAQHLEVVATLRHDARYSTRQVTVVLARGLHASRLVGDERHVIGVEMHRLQDLDALLATGRLTDVSTVAALLLVKERLG
jgi:ADP compounds hydrolase